MFICHISVDFYLILVGGVKKLGMHVSVSRKKYKKVKEVGKTNMSFGTIAFYQLMQVCQAEYFRQLLKPVT
ncbi:hypothetical protein CDL12_03834 [Handroanthus impetiginosus]|uniref:Uncharacterized protein n=1 Tax=Handroanthus impetiginosus TaxID=429701 RepID=A0A2G9I116_9LAMI|nr:hypothetical protein CDL12_03834 [Handroanthus impetiginosus]